MRGHTLLADLRRGGYVPHHVHVDLDLPKLPSSWLLDAARTGYPQVQVEASDALHRLDLRCVVGLVALVSGNDSARVEAISEACRQAGAERVIATMREPRGGATDGVFEVVRITDTQGVLSWQQ